MNISKKDLARRCKQLQGHGLGPEPALQEDLRGRIRPVRRRAVRLPGRRLPLRPQPARRRAAGRDGEDRRRGALPVHRRRIARRVMQMESGRSSPIPRDLTKIFTNAGIRLVALPARVRRRRATSASRMPRFLARLPYGAKTSPVEEFDFEEDTGGADHGKYAWANAAYAMATNINRSFKLYGWCSRIRGVESGGAVEDLPVHTFPTDDGGVDMKCPTEIAISDRREAELAKNGFMPLIHRKNSDFAAFIGAQSLQKPHGVRRPGRDRQRQPGRAAAVPVRLLPVRALPEVHRARQDRQLQGARRHGALANNWIMNYVDGDPAQLVRGNQGAQAAGRRRGRGRGGRRQSRATTRRSSSCGRTTSSRA